MLILPPGHAQAANQLRRLTNREKWMVRGAAAVAAVVVLVLVIALVTGSPKSSKGCIYATIPGPVGAQQVSECGASARSTCVTVFAPGAYAPQAAQTVAAECRKARLPIGR